MENKIKIPVHIGVIMDGNRRWARERNLPTYEGHKKGYELVKTASQWFFEYGVNIVTFYAFSTENWRRSRSEVNYLMKLVSRALEKELDIFMEKDYRLMISGRISDLPGNLPELCIDAQEKTKNNKSGTIHLCLNYGGRAELIDAIKKMIKHNITVDQVHEGMIRKYLYNSGLPDPDIIIRTSGEQRLSGFMTWQGVYSELLFLQKYWPDFEEEDVKRVVREFSTRNRRHGGDG